jgi:hypothetical protein
MVGGRRIRERCHGQYSHTIDVCLLSGFFGIFSPAGATSVIRRPGPQATKRRATSIDFDAKAQRRLESCAVQRSHEKSHGMTDNQQQKLTAISRFDSSPVLRRRQPDMWRRLIDSLAGRTFTGPSR